MKILAETSSVKKVSMEWNELRESYAVVIITFKIIEILIRKDPWRSSAPTSH